MVNPLCSLKTKSFHVTDAYIGCGLCTQNCTGDCIKMIDHHPVWTKDACTYCLGCINRCPVQAIQYGKKTETRGRYVYPIYQTKKNGESNK